MARPRKYATLEDLDALRADVGVQFESVRAEIRANSLNGLKPTLEAIVKEYGDRLAHERAWTMVRSDVRRRFRIPKLESAGERLWAALLGGLGFTVAGKLGELFGFWKTLGEGAKHFLGH